MWTDVSLGCILSSGIADLCGQCHIQLLGELPGCFPQRRRQLGVRVPVSLPPRRCLSLSAFFALAVVGKVYLTVVSICFSLVADRLEHLFMRLLAICVSLGKCLFESFAHCLIVLFVCS